LRFSNNADLKHRRLSILFAGGAFLAFSAVMPAGCTSIPEHYRDAAIQYGLSESDLQGGQFLHRLYAPSQRRRGDVLHIYIEGDGTPYVRRGQPAADPTPRRPLMPMLMVQDPSPHLLLGRPCHHGLARLPPCRPGDWTEARFSASVVDSMARAASALIAEGGHEGAVLIGHSGGGVLALLMAERMPQVQALVVIAAATNLDLWTQRRKLPPLSSSLSPHRSTLNRRNIPILLLAGGDDKVVPPDLVAMAQRDFAGSEYRLYKGFNHACCWAEVWPETLAWIERRRAP
jgi:pimeloyl-ACP methyl ester carboxylesterase